MFLYKAELVITSFVILGYFIKWHRYEILFFGYISYFSLWLAGIVNIIWGFVKFYDTNFQEMVLNNVKIHPKFQTLHSIITWMLWIKMGPLMLCGCCSTCSFLTMLCKTTKDCKFKRAVKKKIKDDEFHKFDYDNPNIC
jgi:hypothetical protein